ncbi:hypothetical protein DL93DRAFT_2171228 [Clavulina sp. PMI_390]|nr:hypothetical protein DL93DRAFT_2171228 [Clavulina sp. PMI_390]
MAALNTFRNNNNGQPPASPTNTAYSGISNYRTDSYRPLRDANAPAVPTIDPRLVAKTHFDELNLFLESHMAKEAPGSRAGAREKLTRLTRQQFQELSTDVYDELVRRKNNSTKSEAVVPFLPVRDEFHPKRNQARQKLATLPKPRFKDLSSDVFVELGRRYPELREPETLTPMTPASVYDDSPNPNLPPAPPPPAMPEKYVPQPNGGRSSGEQYRTSYASSKNGRPSQEDNNGPPMPKRTLTNDSVVSPGYQSGSPEPVQAPIRRPSSSSSYGRGGGQGDNYSRNAPSREMPNRKPSQDYPGSNNNYPSQSRRQPSDDFANNPSPITPSQPGQATTGVIIPNKSMIAEEEIKVPFGQAGDDDDLSPSSSRAGSPEDGAMRVSLQSASTANLREPRSPDGRSPLDRLGQAQAQTFGLNALGANLGVGGGVRSDDDLDETGSERRGGSDYYDKMSFGRTSVQSDVSKRGMGARQSVEDPEKLRRDYEFKIATMQTRMASLEGAVVDANKARDEEVAQRAELEDEIRNLRDASSKQAADLTRIQQELDDALDDKDREVRRSESDRRELGRLQERIMELEAEQRGGGGNPMIEEDLRQEMQALLESSQDMTRQIDELLADKEQDRLLVQTLTAQAKENKRKYEQAKTELRNHKATSQIAGGASLQKNDMRKMPIAETGVIADIHVTTLQSSIDTLLNVARSENPSNVLSAMKPVVNSVAAILDDVKAFEHNPTRYDVSEEHVTSLRQRCEATLQNLVSAARNHAGSYGLSPVSLLDAAASHVSATVIDLVRLLLLRRSTAADRERDRDVRENTRSPAEYGMGSPPPSNGNMPNGNGNHGYKASLRSIEETRTMSPHARAPSSGSNRVRAGVDEDFQRSTSSTAVTSPRGDAISPPAFSEKFDDVATAVGNGSDDATVVAGGDNSWSELKPYLDAQSESLVYNIQTLLSAIRRNVAVGDLDESLTQIITIVNSIVAVSKDSFPASLAERGQEILAELNDHSTKLKEMQNSGEITKTTRTAMATASFGVAKAMKELMKL